MIPMANTTLQLKKDLDRWRFRAEVDEEAVNYYQWKLRRYRIALTVAAVGIVAMILINLL